MPSTLTDRHRRADEMQHDCMERISRLGEYLARCQAALAAGKCQPKDLGPQLRWANQEMVAVQQLNYQSVTVRSGERITWDTLFATVPAKAVQKASREFGAHPGDLPAATHYMSEHPGCDWDDARDFAIQQRGR